MGREHRASRSTTRIVWQDTRTDEIVDELAADGGQERYRARSACRWRPTSPARRSGGSSTTSTVRASAAEAGDLLFGTMDTWVIWNLTGGRDGGVHVTDVDQRQPHAC